MHPDNALQAQTNEVERVIKGLGLDGPGDLLRWAPKTYRDYRSPSKSIEDCHRKGRCAMEVEVVSRRDYSKDGLPIGPSNNQRPFRISMRMRDSNGFEAWTAVFGALQPWGEIKAGNHVIIFAEVDEWNGSLQIRSPELVPYSQVGQMASIYRGKRGRVSAEAVTGVLRDLLRNDISIGVAAIEAKIGLSDAEITKRAGLRFSCLGELLVALHRPTTPAQAFLATNDARALSVFHIKHMARLVKERPATPKARITTSSAAIVALIASLPYELTQDQATAISEIRDDLASDKPMRRLLSGDVGTGKTLTYLIPAVAALDAGAVVMVLTPNILLAEQLVSEVNTFFPGTGTSLILGRGGKRKLDTRTILIGTTALIGSAQKAGVVPDYLICDEQHRLSTGQREALIAPHTNILEATATAIPRTVALATHGGMDVSVLRESPVDKTIITKLAYVEHRPTLFATLEKIVAKGGQIAIIYRRVEDEGTGRANSVEAAARHWERKFPGQVAMLHGRMKDDEKVSILAKVKSGEKGILICSVIIEIGLTIPGLRGLLVVDPDASGVSQLHQLRGRLARQGGHGYMFMLLTRPEEEYEEETLNRLNLVATINDGFELAERDAYARGFGDVSVEGETQDGKLDFLFHGVKITPNDLK